MQQQPQHVARYGRVWQNKKTKEVVGDKLTLKGDEKLSMYEQIPAPKNEVDAKDKNSKPAKEPPTFGGFGDNN